jgi:BirA family biotin operon repressor/biotin-[acetyl-CoA-carboxylase] ligase
VSVLLRPPIGPIEAGLLPIVAAVAVAEAIERFAGQGSVTVAWPNDVLVDGGKVAGILCELSTDQERVSWAVVGIGVNVRAHPRLADARWPPSALAALGPPPRRADLLVELLARLGDRYRGWLGGGSDAVLRAFAARDHLAGREVRVALGAAEIVARAEGLDDLGRLVVLTAEGPRALAAGEVTGVRGAYRSR